MANLTWARRRAAGLCGDCGLTPVNGLSRCDACRAKVNAEAGVRNGETSEGRHRTGPRHDHEDDSYQRKLRLRGRKRRLIDWEEHAARPVPFWVGELLRTFDAAKLRAR